MESERINEVWQLAAKIRQEVENQCKSLFALTERFLNMLHRENLRLPYHINIIDELHIDENAHSRILMQLLRYRNERGEYEIFESLLRYIASERRASEFDRITIEIPEITQEQARIDLWVRDKNTAIIFENKVYNATDQEAQLARYINKTKECGYREDDIFVVYLSQSDSEPADQSWGDYKERFASRYVNLSFRHDIIAWLQKSVLPNIRQKDYLLHSAVLQYIDYLEGMFYMRTIEQQKNMNLDNLLISELALDGKSDKERYHILEEKINDFNEVVQKMKGLQQTYKQHIIDGWKAETEQRFPNLRPNQYGLYTDVTFHTQDGRDVNVHIYEDSKLYCQVEFHRDLPQEERLIADTPIMSLTDLLPSKNDHCVWRYMASDFDGVYDLFVKVVERCQTLFNA